ncbi:hypothetical protein QVZ43_12695 [Marinobacter sp. chi1]|uniref:Transglutaminase-like domain-containing protein n=1 Tax=Marinobacter suaedae TaxID=3057675 RepID=A0ABT8W2V5_9GAMM|nr:hypothetical protein [Marinobacter sp. chi1]MDO3722578.1 hypothetical protein [Marinobacter sp. chi1]
MTNVIRMGSVSFVILGLLLLLLNIYGLSKSLRVGELDDSELRFSGDRPIPFSEAMENIKILPGESRIEYVIRQNKNVDDALAHINWNETDPSEHNLRVPIWENFILYFMGLLSGIPEYQRYHFVQYDKSIERGIGICGDASMTLSTILSKNNIENEILTFPGHVVVTASIGDRAFVLDPDFGVTLNMTADELKNRKSEVVEAYRSAGYGILDASRIVNILSADHQIWSGPSHFIRNKYYFEYLSYWLIWGIPVSLIIAGCFGLKYRSEK